MFLSLRLSKLTLFETDGHGLLLFLMPVRLLLPFGILFIVAGYFLLFLFPDRVKKIESLFVIAMVGMALSILGALLLMIYLFIISKE